MPDPECRQCDGTGEMVVTCSRCFREPADRHQDVEAICADCETILVCACGEEYPRAEWLEMPVVGYVTPRDGYVYSGSLRNCDCRATLYCASYVEQDSHVVRTLDRMSAAAPGWALNGWGRAVALAIRTQEVTT
jgi:hypothetical protein